MKWENDHLKINFPKHKSDQIRLNKDEARDIYSNHNYPSVCPIRALACYLLFFSSMFVDGNKVSLKQIKRNVPIYAYTE